MGVDETEKTRLFKNVLCEFDDAFLFLVDVGDYCFELEPMLFDEFLTELLDGSVIFDLFFKDFG